MIPHRIRFRLLLIMLILTDWCAAQQSNDRRRRRPLDFNSSKGTMHPMGDQIALANSWQSSNRVISASYAGNPDTGHVDHANFVVNLLPAERTPHQPTAKDLAIAEQLANTRTAAEYVNEAMRMRFNRHLKVPQSSYIKYDVYEKQKMKMFTPPPLESDESDENDSSNELNEIFPPAIKYIVSTDSNEKENRPLIPPAVTTRSSHHYTDYVNSSRKPDYHNSQLFGGHGSQLYTSYGTTYKNHYDPSSKDSLEESDEEFKKKGRLPKHELIKHIQQSVMKYMKELEAEGKFTPTPTQSAPIVIKTYYRFPTSTPSPEELHNDYVKSTIRYVGSSDGPSEYYKYPPRASPSSAHSDHAHTTVSTNDLYPSTTMTPPSYQESDEMPTPNIDLTFRSKSRPKPIDLAALDVGQSWSHDSESHPENPQTHINHKKMQRPKFREPLNFDTQTYHDINSMDMPKTKSNPPKKIRKTNSSHDHKQVTSVRFKDDPQSTGHQSEAALSGELNENELNEVQKHYQSPIHVINGIPVVNPYRFNMHQLNELFADQKEHRSQKEQESNESTPTKSQHKETGWMPSFSPIPSFTKPLRKPSEHLMPNSKPKPSKTTTYHHNLPYDSYNPKYNNNPEGVGYQEDYRSGDLDETSHSEPSSSSSDLFSSSTSKRSKKARPPTGYPVAGSKSKKNAKRPVSTTTYSDKVRSKVGGIKNRSPETELRPPRFT